MGRLTTEEVARLRVPLAKLPRFNPRGLWVKREADLAVATVGNEVWAIDPANGETFDKSGAWFVDLCDSATRDWVARWLLGRLSLRSGCTAPRWTLDGDEGTWGLSGVEHAQFTSEADGGSWVVPALDTFDPNDIRLLPDGSRWADALALAIVATYFGSTP